MSSVTRSTYSLVTLAYWAFMLTDGALRMLVLLRFHQAGYSPLQLAFLFLLYESAGILTNLLGGWFGARYGLRRTLFLGLGTQIIALTALSLISFSGVTLIPLLLVMAVQAFSGVAKDLTKMSSKSSVKLLIPEENEATQSTLFSWVAFLTGTKNALKGAGFFLGGFLLTLLGYQTALLSLAAFLLFTLIVCLILLRTEFGKSKREPKLSNLFSKSSAINKLSFARAFLFSSRDVWFVVGLPIFLHEKLEWSFSQVGGFMAAWVIAYGFIQALAPKITRATTGPASAVRTAQLWGIALLATCSLLPLSLLQSFIPLGFTLLIGLAVFGFVFAVNSSVHSYLILAYTTDDEVSLDVGFYYMANAAGRLTGTLCSGLCYMLGGIHACLWTATLFSLISALMSRTFPRHTSS